VPYDKGLSIHVDTASYVGRELYFRGEYESAVTRALYQYLREGNIAFDAGAYIGTHTLIMAKLVGKTGKVFAFEPNPEAQKLLLENIAINNFENVTMFDFALSDQEGTKQLFSYSDTMQDTGTASLYPLENLHPESTVVVSTIDVVVEKNALNRLDVIKIDTRGSDLSIILGARESIKLFRPCVIFEYNENNWKHAGSTWEEAQSFFYEQNYSLYLLGNNNNSLLTCAPTAKTSHNILAVSLK
jgi:FkbM family methyltransferase